MNELCIVDAVKVIPTDAQPNKAVWTPTIPATDSYKVYAFLEKGTAHYCPVNLRIAAVG